MTSAAPTSSSSSPRSCRSLCPTALPRHLPGRSSRPAGLLLSTRCLYSVLRNERPGTKGMGMFVSFQHRHMESDELLMAQLMIAAMYTLLIDSPSELRLAVLN